MKTFIQVMAGISDVHGKTHGVFELNGHKLKPKQFSERVAYIPQQDVSTELTLIEYLKFYSNLIKPATTTFNKNEMVS